MKYLIISFLLFIFCSCKNEPIDISGQWNFKMVGQSGNQHTEIGIIKINPTIPMFTGCIESTAGKYRIEDSVTGRLLQGNVISFSRTTEVPGLRQQYYIELNGSAGDGMYYNNDTTASHKYHDVGRIEISRSIN